MNADRLKRFPDQNSEHRPVECVAETIADIVGNIYGQPFDPGFNYGATFDLTGDLLAQQGLDPIAAFYAQCANGSLPIADQDFDATTKSELFEADFSNYSIGDKQLAGYFKQKGIIRLNGYDEIVNYINRTGWGVAVVGQWYDSFAVPNQDGTLPVPAGSFTTHCVATYEGTPLGLRQKSWQGPNYGVGGYNFMDRTVYNLVAYEALAFDPNADPRVTALWIRFYLLRKTLAILLRSFRK